MTSTEPTAPDPGRCPLCGGENHCPMALHPPGQGSCWCYDLEVPHELLARVPEHLRRRACICADCILNPPGAPSS